MHIQTPLVSLLLSLATTTSALQYHVANCGRAVDQGSNADATKSACQGVLGTFCDRTGLNRCVVNDDFMEQFQEKCQQEGLEETYVMPAAVYDLGSARRLAGCLV